MKNILIIISLLVGSLVFAQIAPPPPSIPTADNKVLIDELIKVTEYENYFNNYCKTKVDQFAKENNWDENKKQNVLDKINFKDFDKTIYNCFSKTKKEDLHELIKIFKKLNIEYPPMIKIIPINGMIQNNLDLFTKNIIQGKK